ncbi:MAG TPA: acyl-CoA dehydrogenase family protein, partial [Bacillota bacterium]
MFPQFQLPAVQLPEHVERLRAEVRAFIAEELRAGTFEPRCDSWLSGFSPEFSRKLGERGWIGMTWPKAYGGHERSGLERFVVTEEFLAAGAPVTAHWIADRQSGPLLLRYGTEEQKRYYLPRIARGECYFCIGMSEPDAGSDLAGLRTRAERVGDRWILNGRKIWTSQAQHCHYMIVLCRTAPPSEDRHAGLSQFIVDLSAPGVTIRPIPLLTGEPHFNEVRFDNVELRDDQLVGELGNGWRQVLTELAFERSGPERFMSTFPLLVELVRAAGETDNERARTEIGRLVARLWTLRRMSLGVAALLDQGQVPEQ